MSAPKVVEVTEVVTANGEINSRHPSFASVSVARVNVSGNGEVLFGTPVKARSYIQIAINHAEGNSKGLSERHWPTKTIATVKLSEGQWASLLSSINNANGVPATLERAPSPDAIIQRYPDIVRETEATRWEKIVSFQLQKELSNIQKLAEDLSKLAEVKGAISKTEMKQVVHNLKVALNNAPKNFEFAASEVTEHMEKVAEAIKIEISAHAANVGLTVPKHSNLLEENVSDD